MRLNREYDNVLSVYSAKDCIIVRSGAVTMHISSTIGPDGQIQSRTISEALLNSELEFMHHKLFRNKDLSNSEISIGFPLCVDGDVTPMLNNEANAKGSLRPLVRDWSLYNSRRYHSYLALIVILIFGEMRGLLMLLNEGMWVTVRVEDIFSQNVSQVRGLNVPPSTAIIPERLKRHNAGMSNGWHSFFLDFPFRHQVIGLYAGFDSGNHPIRHLIVPFFHRKFSKCSIASTLLKSYFHALKSKVDNSSAVFLQKKADLRWLAAVLWNQHPPFTDINLATPTDTTLVAQQSTPLAKLPKTPCPTTFNIDAVLPVAPFATVLFLPWLLTNHTDISVGTYRIDLSKQNVTKTEPPAFPNSLL
ncbi:hypothetical protein IW261DRAFT_1425441 [Armillaria novae-zelandiae]|uniref:Uncharacterized protein n=1 Tax=Armillaria novae-zelandiae TaxID=153914 RepID=A0AA39TV79_9AGAR|nr:hypothetical protein IW261DRAFT_1425441 [Armillaria novae-zelandiae]